jgi:hypothetical protein
VGKHDEFAASGFDLRASAWVAGAAATDAGIADGAPAAWLTQKRVTLIGTGVVNRQATGVPHARRGGAQQRLPIAT